MPVAVDHLIIITPSLEKTISFFQQNNIDVFTGGKHPSLGTMNAIIPLDNNVYIELLAKDPQASPRPTYPLGLNRTITDMVISGWAVRRTDIIEYVNMSRMKSKYVDRGEVRNMSRFQPDGKEISWQIAYTNEQYNNTDGAIPFLINWNDMSSHPAALNISNNKVTLSRFLVGTPLALELSNELSELNNPAITIEYATQTYFEIELYVNFRKLIITSRSDQNESVIRFI